MWQLCLDVIFVTLASAVVMPRADLTTQISQNTVTLYLSVYKTLKIISPDNKSEKRGSHLVTAQHRVWRSLNGENVYCVTRLPQLMSHYTPHQASPLHHQNCLPATSKPTKKPLFASAYQISTASIQPLSLTLRQSKGNERQKHRNPCLLSAVLWTNTYR